MSNSFPRPSIIILLLVLPYISSTLGAQCLCRNTTDQSILGLIQVSPPTLSAVSTDPAASALFRGLYALSCGPSYYQQVKDFFNTIYSEEYKAYADCGAQCSANPSCVAYFAEVKTTTKTTCTFKCHLYLKQYCIRGSLKGATHGFYSATIPRAPVGQASASSIPLVTACSGNSQGCTVADSSYNASASVPTTGIPAFGLIDPDDLVAGQSPINGATSCDLDGLSPVSGVIKGLIRTTLASSSFPDFSPEDCAQQVLSVIGAQYFSWIPANICTGTCYVYLVGAFPYGAASGAVSQPPFDPTAPAFTGQLPLLPGM